MTIPSLKRAGIALVVVGLLDIALMVYCIVNQVSYSSSFNVFAVIAGIFLLRGSLRAASVVRWLAMFFLASFIAVIVLFPFLQPTDLTLTQIRLNPGASIMMMAVMVTFLVLFAWLVRTLGHPEIRAAREAAGRTQRSLILPAALGAGMLVLLVPVLYLSMNGESAGKAKAMAAQRIGPGYQYSVNSMSIVQSDGQTSYRANVTAWSENDIQHVPVHWNETD